MGKATGLISLYTNSTRHVTVQDMVKKMEKLPGSPKIAYYLRWKGGGLVTTCDAKGKGVEGFGSSASGSPEPLFTMPEISENLRAVVGGQPKEDKTGEKTNSKIARKIKIALLRRDAGE